MFFLILSFEVHHISDDKSFDKTFFFDKLITVNCYVKLYFF